MFFTKIIKIIVFIAPFLFSSIVSASKVSPYLYRTLSNPEYGTHMAPLLTIVARTQGPILEMGCGDYSTPLLHAICSATNRYILSTDTDKKWLSLFLDLQNQYHDFQHVPVYENNINANLWDAVGNDRRWSVVLIDHRPGERRAIDIERLRSTTDIFVVHDTQQPTYGYQKVFATFKYCYTYQRYAITTTVVSDSININDFFKN